MNYLLLDIVDISFSIEKSRIYLNKSIYYLSVAIKKNNSSLNGNLLDTLISRSENNLISNTYFSWYANSLLRSISHEKVIDVKGIEYAEVVFSELINENRGEENLGINYLHFESNNFKYYVPINLPEILRMKFDDWKEFESSIKYDQWEINFSKSIELIEKINPELITCINLLVENILVVYSQGNSHGSMSPKNIIGTVYLPDIEDFTLLAECLIHEALHQYLYRLEHCASLFVENEGIKEIYYSPWKDEPRPLIMVLHGAFVFTGVILYYHQLCEKNIIPDMIEEFKIRLSKRHVQVSVAVEVLLKNNKLTGFGTQIVEIIQENLREVTQSGFLDVSTSMNDVLDHKLKFSGKDYIHANI